MMMSRPVMIATVRQPLLRMGQIAAQTLVDRIESRAAYVPEVAIEPEFVIRESTGPAPPLRSDRIL
jgi:DNA-binding LacI/PurR family transcriptional regulator